MTVPVHPVPAAAGADTEPYPVRYLTPCQRQVLHYAANGHTNKEIGRQLGTSEDTVKSQMAAVLRRLHVEDRAQAVAVGIRLGLVDLNAVTVSPRPVRAPRGTARATAVKNPAVEELEDELADIGDRVRAERQARGWSQTELARRARVGRMALSHLEKGQPTLMTTLVLACRALGVEVGHLLSAEWEMPERGGVVVLSRQQVLVLREAASGDSLARVGKRLGMTRPAVSSHLSRVYLRLGVSGLPRSERRQAAVRVAVEHGLLAAGPSDTTPTGMEKRTS